MIDGEVIIINLETGIYYSLMKSGVEVWQSIERNATVEEIVAALVRHYEATRDTLEGAATRCLDELQREGLIETFAAQAIEDTEAPGTPSDGDSASRRRALELPVLEKYDDMKDLILLDPVHEIDEEQDWPDAKQSAGR
jgi:hypothetical protein